MIDLVLRNRSYRRFDENTRLSDDYLRKLINLARLCPSSRNQQALKYMMVNSREKCDIMFPSLEWAGYISGWHGPVEGERPPSYIIILGDNRLGKSFSTDLGIAAQTLLLGAAADGYGGCMIASVKREKVRTDFNIQDDYDILLVVAVGKPVEKVVIEDVRDGDVRYWRDEQGVHHVPKRGLNEIIVE